MALGRPDEAKADFQKGAALETTGADRVYPVSYSLQRVQGPNRIEIERQRQQARLVSHTRTIKASQARYEQLQDAEGQVLRNPSRPQPAPAKELVGTPPADDPSDPFGGDAQPIQPEAAPEHPPRPSLPTAARICSVIVTPQRRCPPTLVMLSEPTPVPTPLQTMRHQQPRQHQQPNLPLIRSPIPSVNLLKSIRLRITVSELIAKLNSHAVALQM